MGQVHVRPAKHSLVILIGCCLSGCAFFAELDKSLRQMSNQLLPRDPVTNRRVPNVVSRQEEIAEAEKVTRQILQELRAEGIQVDTPTVLQPLEAMVQRIARVSHLPDYPWEVHFIEAGNVNAFTVGGGKIFVYAGLFGQQGLVLNDNELAAVLAHEIAHVTCRHIPESKTWSALGPAFSKRIGGKMYQAVYSTQDEDEADKVGVLYMALAGYDPGIASSIWRRAHEQFGSKPGNYLYDHSLNIDRARNTERWGRVARKYYAGPGKVNPQYKQILVNNALIDRVESSDNESGLAAVLEGAAESYKKHTESKIGQKQREVDKAKREQELRSLLPISDLAFRGKTVTFKITGRASKTARKVRLEFYWYDGAGKLLTSQYAEVPNLRTWETRNLSYNAYPGAGRVSVVVTDAEWER